jgi:hypothetical protein
MPLKTCHITVLPFIMHEIDVRSTPARNGAVDAYECDSEAEILFHDIVTADIFTVSGVESEDKGPDKEVMQWFLPLWKIKFSQGCRLSAIKIVALRNDVVTPAIYVG